MEVLSYITILMVGITLSVLGGGGSILTVPILVFLFKLPAVTATSYSLFLVGISAALGAWKYGSENLIAYRTGFAFTLPSLLGVFIVRRFLMSIIPPEIELVFLEISKDQLILSVFALVMLMASVAMIRPQKKVNKTPLEKKPLNLAIIAAEGLMVGGVTGFVGAGGGFLIIPALVLVAGLPIKQAIGTSLLIIAAKSLLGFIGDIGVISIDWSFLITISVVSLVGIVVGSKLAQFIRADLLRPTFGYFTLILAVLIIGQQTIL